MAKKTNGAPKPDIDPVVSAAAPEPTAASDEGSAVSIEPVAEPKPAEPVVASTEPSASPDNESPIPDQSADEVKDPVYAAVPPRGSAESFWHKTYRRGVTGVVLAAGVYGAYKGYQNADILWSALGAQVKHIDWSWKAASAAITGTAFAVEAGIATTVASSLGTTALTRFTDSKRFWKRSLFTGAVVGAVICANAIFPSAGQMVGNVATLSKLMLSSSHTNTIAFKAKSSVFEEGDAVHVREGAKYWRLGNPNGFPNNGTLPYAVNGTILNTGTGQYELECMDPKGQFIGGVYFDKRDVEPGNLSPKQLEQSAKIHKGGTKTNKGTKKDFVKAHKDQAKREGLRRDENTIKNRLDILRRDAASGRAALLTNKI